MKILYYILIMFSFILCLNANQATNLPTDMPGAASLETHVRNSNNRIVSLNINGDMAVKIAEVVLVNIYGEEVLRQKPWKVYDNGAEIVVQGIMPKNRLGGVAKIVIRKSDAKIISYHHGK